jgi:orotidine-5'-phosphate decarboxylase
VPPPAQPPSASVPPGPLGDPGGEPRLPAADASERPTPRFGERLAERVRARESQIVLGLDPDPMALWPGCAELPSEGSVAKRAANAVEAHCRALVEAAGPACVAVKPQLARFEALGGRGWEVLRTVCKEAREAGLLTILDAKRGDIDLSARAYATALMGELQTPFGPVKGLKADMITVNPLLGRDALEPFVAGARELGAHEGRRSGVLVLVRTSNPGAADVQDAELAGGGAVWERLALLVDALGAEEPAGGRHAGVEGSPAGVGSGQVDVEGGRAVGESGLAHVEGGPAEAGGGLADVGAVMGATEPRHLVRARELMPRAVFLLPGVGAQGGRVEDLAPAFAPGRAGGLIAASRSIANAHVAVAGRPADAARAEAERLRELAWRVSA